MGYPSPVDVMYFGFRVSSPEVETLEKEQPIFRWHRESNKLEAKAD